MTATTEQQPNKPQASVPGLPGFQRLNHKTYLHDPATASPTPPATAARTPNSTGTPSLILVCSWMDAQPKHVAKYTTYYRTLYPASPILLVTSATADFFFNPASRQKRELAPALAAICSYVPTSSTSTDDDRSDRSGGGGLLVHALSNGGCGHLAMLCTQYRSLTGHALPARSVIYDSAPGRSRFAQGLAAMSLALPSFPLARWPLQALIAVLLVVFFHLPPLLGVQTVSMAMRERLNDGVYLRAEAPRLYVYSSADAVILAPDVEEHAAEAEGKGWVVERAVFEGSAHVGHMRLEPERYWELVATAWERRA
ncbi:uncharacterized protein BKCO1_3300084 [Diplodia corticola]|uniref:Indole-diterpene biosynthesis protein n=1 Tax=Diplodia corticola TaxID=236234 RepID=A0A1J9RKN9_9PEZI|nr:uncharacterized protein BKCO1_3300084 [Diplodia corticola]OJD33155.1 hypothetical protein BKCO1_3300084 [Diplodia corticola]